LVAAFSGLGGYLGELQFEVGFEPFGRGLDAASRATPALLAAGIRIPRVTSRDSRCSARAPLSRLRMRITRLGPACLLGRLSAAAMQAVESTAAAIQALGDGDGGGFGQDGVTVVP
jgi:hypothetical protein